MEKQRVFVKIKNFKSLVDIEVELKPLTFLFGSNAAGKSSFINALKFFGNYISKVLNPEANFNPYPSYSALAFKIDEHTDLGSFKEIVTNNDITKQIEFEIIVKNCSSRVSQLGLIEFSETEMTQLEYFDFSVKFVFGNAKTDVTLLKSITISDFVENLSCSYDPIMIRTDDNQYPHYEPTVTTIDSKEEHPLKNILKENYLTPAFNSRQENKTGFETFIEKRMLELKLSNSYSNEQVLNLFERFFILIPETVHEIFCNPLHVPSLREIPEKSYLLFNGRFDFWAYYGLMRGADEDKNKNTFTGMDFLQRVNYYLLDFFKFDEFILVKKETLAGSILVEDKKNHISYNLSNASSGFLQLLPVVVLINHEHVYKLFLCEQPELHLHPKLQTKLAEFFTLDEFKNKYKVIETHSEHIIRKIQVLIKNGKLNKEDVVVYYFDKQSGKTTRKEMEFEDNGFFKEPWPDSFFDDSYNLAKELLFARKN